MDLITVLRWIFGWDFPTIFLSLGFVLLAFKYQMHNSVTKMGFGNVNRKRYYQHLLIRLEYILNTKNPITEVFLAECSAHAPTKSDRNCGEFLISPFSLLTSILLYLVQLWQRQQPKCSSVSKKITFL